MAPELENAQLSLMDTVLDPTATTKYNDNYASGHRQNTSLMATELQDTTITQPGACWARAHSENLIR
jgi:hypothetical protein